MNVAALDTAIQANPCLWLETQTMIRAANGKLMRPRANILQRRIFAYHAACKRANRAVRGIGLKPRKRGFSTGVGGLHYTELQRGTINGVVVGNKIETAATVFSMMKVFSECDEQAKQGKWGSVAKFGVTEANWAHGSHLTQSSALGGGSIRGQTPQFVHGTECAHWEQQETTLLALLNAVPDDPATSIWLESTPNGKGDEFSKTWDTGRWPTPDECPDGVEYWREWERECPNQPENTESEFGFVRIFAAWFEFDSAIVRLTEEQKQHIRQSLDAKEWYKGESELIQRYGRVRPSDGAERLGAEIEIGDVWEQLAWRRMTISTKCGHDPLKFDQEYPRDPESCFLASGSKYFDADCIKHFQERARQVNWEFGQIDEAAHGRAVWRGSAPEVSIFKRCEHSRVGCAYLISADSAEGDDQATGKDPDLHSILVLRRAYRDSNGVFWPERVVARVKHPSRVPLQTLAKFIDLLSRLYGRCPAIIEMNNTGLALLKLCQQLGVPLWKRTDFNPRTGKEEQKLGWRTTDNADYGGLRSLILAHLHKKLMGDTNAEGETEFAIDICCENIVYQLAMFGEKDGKLQGLNCHDDDVLSLAIGSYNIDAAITMEQPSVARSIPPEWRSLYGDGQSGDGLAMRS